MMRGMNPVLLPDNIAQIRQSRLASIVGRIHSAPDIEARISAIGTTDETGMQNYRVIISALKNLGIWTALSNGFLFGNAHQVSSTSIKSINGGADASGTGTASTFYNTLNGTSDKYSYNQAIPLAIRAEKTLIAVFLDSNTSTDHISHVLSSYSGGVAKGPAIYSGGSSISGSSGTKNKVYGFYSGDGSASSAEQVVASATAGGIVFAVSRHDGDYANMMIHGKNSIYTALSGSIWDNGVSYYIGSNPAPGVYLSGRIYATFEFNSALTDEQISQFVSVLRWIFCAPDGKCAPYLLWLGNSLTGSASGGGTTWADKLIGKSAWSTAYPITSYYNAAVSGAKILTHGEAQYLLAGQRFAPLLAERSIAFVWHGINDITAGSSADMIIASLQRLCFALLADGWEVHLLNLTPVANVGEGLSYGYGPAQQAILAQVNAWIAQQYLCNPIDLYTIGNNHPEFLSPTNSMYYVTGDGLHHNDAGRTLIADYVASVVTP